MLRGLTHRLSAADVLTVLFSVLLALLALVFHSRMPEWRLVLGVSAAIAFGLPLLAALSPPEVSVGVAADPGSAPGRAAAGCSAAGAPPAASWGRAGRRLLAFAHDWAFAPLAYVIYLEMQAIVGPLRGEWIADATLIAIDRWIFGADPSILLAQFASPWFTELLQIAYTSFYALMVVVGLELYLKRDLSRFRLYAFSCALGFFVSFIGYLAVPAVGPRFTLFDVATVERQLPGLWLTPALRAFVDGGGLVPPGLSREAARALAPRDVFPSGHTMMTLVAIYWSWRFRLRVRRGIAMVGGLLVLATVYLRYHYVVDVLAGATLAALCVTVTPALYRRLTRRPAPATVVAEA